MLTYAALSPHPPLIVPYIGKERLKDVDSTVTGMRQMAALVVQSRPETIVFFTPHGNVFADCVTVLTEPELYGDFTGFGIRQNGNTYRNDLELLGEIAGRAASRSIPVIGVDNHLVSSYQLEDHLDHGILVPLHYLEEAGLTNASIIAISVGMLPLFDLYTLGREIREASHQLGRRIAIVASGDMSHHLKSEGPYSFHPDGPRFDAAIKALISAGDVKGIMAIDEGLRENAGECGFRSIVMMLGALDGLTFQSQVFSYEGPYGVGYLVAGFRPGDSGPSYWEEIQKEQRRSLEEKRRDESPPVRWARMVLESYVQKHPSITLPTELKELEQNRAGAFVSLKKRGQLRGCIGTISPLHKNLAEEIRANAVNAAAHDYRFEPVEPEELDDLVYSVDILGEPEACTMNDLDPQRYGVIVTQGARRGLLLPDLEGVDTVEHQVQIALQKAGIKSEPYEIERFTVTRYK